MPGPERPIPEWARKERLQDHAWIRENMEAFYIAASFGFFESGRGAVVIDTTVQFEDFGHPFAYFDQEIVEEGLDEDTKRMVTDYDPQKEMVIVLLKPKNRTSTYRVRQQPGEPGTEKW